MSDKNFYPVRVQAVQKAAEQSVVIHFELNEEQKQLFKYQSGQYITLKVQLNGQEERRAYSICSSPYLDKTLSIGVKKMTNGKVSTYLHDQLKAGDTLELMPPQGHFCVYTDLADKKDYFMLAGGSGITPIFSMLKTVLETEPKSKVFLYYGSKSEEAAMFRDELEKLAQRYKDQLFVEYILSQPKTEKKGGLFGFFAKTTTLWQGEVGRMNKEKIAKFVQKYRSDDQRAAAYYLCGPEQLMETAQQTLAAMGIAEAEIFREHFYTSSPAQSGGESLSHGSATVTATINGQTSTVELLPKETILQGFIRSKQNPPFSCLSGACSTCMAKVLSGEVKMDRCLALSDKEVKDGYILTCTSRPVSDTVVISYDV